MNMIATARLKAAQNKMEKSRVFFATVSRALEGKNMLLVLIISSQKKPYHQSLPLRRL
jgi:F0F1-type ATP synthase gamma subunit